MLTLLNFIQPSIGAIIYTTVSVVQSIFNIFKYQANIVLFQVQGVFCRNWLKLRITFQPLMQKARVVEQKTQRGYVDSRETMWGSQSGGRGLNRLLDLVI